MRSEGASVRQIAVVVSAGLLAPVVDYLPGALAQQAGRAGWTAVLLALPILLLWVALLGNLLRREEDSLPAVVRRRFGRVGSWIFFLIYIMWAVVVLARRLNGAAGRLGRVYGDGAGAALALTALLLAVWLTRGTLGALCRAGQMVWLGLLAVAVGVVLLALPKMEWSRVVPDGGWSEMPGAVGLCLEWASVAAFGAVLTKEVSRERSGRLLRWTAGVGLLCTALLFIVYGHTGAGLAARLEEPFLIMVQGLSVKGAFARLEALVAALWLGADLVGMALPLYAVRILAGERFGRWVAAGLAAAGVILWFFAGQPEGIWLGIGAGIGLPVFLWLAERKKDAA